MVIPQLLACGVPMIITPNTGGENMVTDGENGFVVPVRSSEAITEKIELLYHDRQKLQVMKDKAAQTARQNFTWDAYGDRYEKFLDSLV